MLTLNYALHPRLPIKKLPFNGIICITAKTQYQFIQNTQFFLFLQHIYPNIHLINDGLIFLPMIKLTRKSFFQKATLFIFLLTISFGFSQTTYTESTPGTSSWTVPTCGVTSITIEAWGAGGAGGGSTAKSKGGQGGGGGAYTTTTIAVTGGQVIDFTVGAGGTGSTGDGTNGGDTTVTLPALTAGGGYGGKNTATGAGTFGDGGTATGGTTNTSGTDGGNGGGAPSGSGGASPNGGATAAGVAKNNDGNNGNPAGGGGSGGTKNNSNQAGGNGADGQVSITYTVASAYCAITTITTVEAITNVTFESINNTTAAGTAGGGHEIFCDNANVLQGSSYAISINGDTGGAYYGAVTAFFDWDQNGSFNNTDERYDIGELYNNNGAGTPVTSTILVPAGASIGTTGMRIIKKYTASSTYATDECTPGSTFGQVEDYKVTVASPGPCTTPTAQATGLGLVVSGTIINGTFTAASPAPNSYLVVVNTTNVAPTPVDTNTYSIGDTIGAGNTVVDIDSNTSFTASGLNPTTTYYFFIYSYNNACTGGPNYFNTSPLTDNATTGTVSYCVPSVTSGVESNGYMSEVSFVGTLNDVTNTSTYSSAPLGYEDYTGLPSLAIQAQGEGVNIFVQALNTSYMKCWVDWNKDGTFDDTTELVYNTGGVSTYSTTFGFIVPATTPIGNYRVRIRLNSTDVTYTNPNSTDVFTSCGNINYGGETEDYLFTVIESCDALITSFTDGETCGASGTVDLTATGSAGTTQYHWYDSLTGGTLLETNAGTYTTPTIFASTTYYVTADNGCESYVRTAVTATLSPTPTLAFTPSVPVLCGEDNIVAITASGDKEEVFLIDEDFESGLGGFTNEFYISNASDALTTWQVRSSTYVPNNQVWFPAISSGFGPNKFAMATSDVGTDDTHNAILSPVVDSSTFLDLTLTLDAYYSRYYTSPTNPTLEFLTFDVSTDGGTSWIEERRYLDDIGIGTRFEKLTFDFSAYINETNLRIRIRQYGEWCDGIAIDNVKLFGFRPLTTALTWSSPVDAFTDPAATIPYVGGPITIVYVKPTPAQLELSSWTFTANATLNNGCVTSKDISITNNTKYFQGADNNWNNPTNWKPVGVPTSSNCVIIPDTYTANVPSGFDGDAYNVSVRPDGDLTIQSTASVTVQNYVNVNAGGDFIIEDTGSLIQVQDQAHIDYVANTGDIDMKRIANIRKTDYVFWSSPVANFPVTSISPTTSTGFIWNWAPTVAANTNGFGIWQNTTENMIDGKGYIVRGPEAFTSTLQDYTATLSGVPNNGTVTRTVTRGTYTGADYAGPSALMVTKNDDNLNLIGNPYPSAIDAQAFMTANTTIEGAVHIWTHGTSPSAAIADPFYADYGQNYTIADYISYNSVGASSGAGVFSGNIAAGQGFFVTMEDTGATSEVVTFDNTMRDRTYGNADFYRTENSDMAAANNVTEKHRIWLDLTAPNNQYNRILIGYVTGATVGKDRLFDATNINKTDFRLYSKADDHKLLIQGRPVPFVETDKVDLEAMLPSSGTYTFAINSLDGLFEDENQAIYLEDKELGIIHDLRNSPYTFDADSGVQQDRFVLRYTDENKQLGVEDVITNNELSIFTANNQVTAVSNTSNIKSFTMYDVNGRLLTNNRNLNVTEYSINTNNYSTGTYLVTIELKDGRSLTKKVVF